MFSSLNVLEFQRQLAAKMIAGGLWRLLNGKTAFSSRRCQQCRYDESATAYTVFHNLKFGLLKAFYATFRYCKKKGISSHELAKEIG